MHILELWIVFNCTSCFKTFAYYSYICSWRHIRFYLAILCLQVISKMSKHLILRRSMHVLASSRTRQILASNRNAYRHHVFGLGISRNFITMTSILRSVLKIRYIVLGSAVGGGIHMNSASLPRYFIIQPILMYSFFCRNTKNGRMACQTLSGSRI